MRCIRLPLFGILGLMHLAPSLVAQTASTRFRLVPDLTIDLDGLAGPLVTLPGPIALGPQGTLLLADRREAMLWSIDPLTRRFKVLGQKGAGPGEFSQIAELFRLGDSIVATDPSLRRFTLYRFDGAGRLARTIPMGRNLAALLAGGRVLTETPLLAAAVAAGGTGPWPLVLMSADGSGPDTLLLRKPPQGSAILRGAGAGTMVVRNDGLTELDDSPFWRVAPGGTGVLLIDRTRPTDDQSAVAQLTWVRVDGTRAYGIEIREPPLRVPPLARSRIVEDMARMISPRFGSLGEARQIVNRSIQVPEFYPSMTDAFISESATAWLRLAPRGNEVEWVLVNRDGSTLGRLRTPTNLHLRAGTEELVWGVLEAPDGTLQLQRSRITK